MIAGAPTPQALSLSLRAHGKALRTRGSKAPIVFQPYEPWDDTMVGIRFIGYCFGTQFNLIMVVHWQPHPRHNWEFALKWFV
jgi:hypothetical protein